MLCAWKYRVAIVRSWWYLQGSLQKLCPCPSRLLDQWRGWRARVERVLKAEGRFSCRGPQRGPRPRELYRGTPRRSKQLTQMTLGGECFSLSYRSRMGESRTYRTASSLVHISRRRTRLGVFCQDQRGEWRACNFPNRSTCQRFPQVPERGCTMVPSSKGSGGGKQRQEWPIINFWVSWHQGANRMESWRTAGLMWPPLLLATQTPREIPTAYPNATDKYSWDERSVTDLGWRRCEELTPLGLEATLGKANE